ncbi:unnamed protein product [Ectocarpus sp. 12 AP-2014]
MSGVASRSTGNSLLRVSQACETLLSGFNSGKAAAVGSCVVSRKHAVTVSERDTPRAGDVDKGPEGEAHHSGPSDHLLPLESAMANRRARPSLLLPAWRAVGFAVGTGATALLPAEASAKVGAAISRAVLEHYDENIRAMYDARIVDEEQEVKELFKAQRDEPSRVVLSPSAGPGAGGTGDDADDSGENADDARSMAVAGTLKSALRAACTVTAKI